MWRKTLLVIALFTASLTAQVVSHGIHPEDMDKTCKPCDDFWRYANGGWLDSHPIPADKQSWGSFITLSDSNRAQLRDLLESAAADKSTAPDSNRRKMADLYTSCMDTAAIDARGLAPLKPDLDRVAAIRTRQDLIAVLAAMEHIVSPADSSSPAAVAAPFLFGSGRDLKNPKNVIGAVVEQAGAGGAGTSIFSMPGRDYYLKDDAKSRDLRDAFGKHVATLLTLAGTAPDAAAAQAKTVLAFETELAQSAMTNADRRDPDKTYHLMTAAQVDSLTPEFDWKHFLLEMDLPDTTPINITQPELLKKFNQQLNSVSIDDWKTWLHWRILKISAPYLAKPVADEDFHFNQGVLAGIQEREPRWQTCVKIVDQDFSDGLGEAYVTKYFPPEAKRRMGILVENIRGAMREELQNADWLAPQTRQNAVRKLDAVVMNIGYPDHWRDYSALTFDRARYFENIRGAWRHNEQYLLAKIGKPPVAEWGMTAPTVNANSSSIQVAINFPAGILQPPFFDMNADDAVNYGAIGAVIGHELGHQFDDQGSKFDLTGALSNWWTESDRAKFDARAACVVQQFDNIDVGDGQHHNGRQVLGEAMGDLGGVSVAYRAYKRSLAGKPEPAAIDGMTGDQRFFIAFARVWGTNIRPEAMRLQLATNPHPLARYRANATLANIPEFQRAFQCKLGDPMVRPAAQQCKLW